MQKRKTIFDRGVYEAPRLISNTTTEEMPCSGEVHSPKAISEIRVKPAVKWALTEDNIIRYVGADSPLQPTERALVYVGGYFLTAPKS